MLSLQLSSLHMAAREGNENKVKELVKRRADVNVKDIRSGVTPLHMAAEGGYVSIVEFLVDSGAEIDVKENTDLTPLHKAVISDNKDVVVYLAGRGAKINTKDYLHKTPLHLAAALNQLDIVKYLVEDKAADMYVKDTHGLTPLHRAARRGRKNIVEYFVQKGAAIDSGDNEQKTPLHWAAEGGHNNTVKYLVGKGASKDIKDCKGRTPCDLADVRGHTKIVQFLRGGGEPDDVDHSSYQSKEETSGLLPKERQHKSDEVVHQVSGTTTVERLSEEILELRREISTLREKNLVLQEEIRKFKSNDQPPPPHENKRGQKRSPSGSSVSDDSVSPPPVKKKRCHKRHQHSTPSLEQTRGASPLSQKPDDRRELNEAEHISDVEISQRTRRRAGLESVDGTTVLDEGDLRDVRSAVARLAGRWKDLGISLGIHSSRFDAFDSHSTSDCLREMLTLWLRQSYNVERLGKPTWRRLVEAVEDDVGGNNPALAQTIAKDHPGAHAVTRPHLTS